MRKSEMSAFIKKRKALIGAVLGGALMTVALFLLGDKEGAQQEADATGEIIARAVACEFRRARGEEIDCDSIVVTPTVPPPPDAAPVSFATIPPLPEEPEHGPDETLVTAVTELEARIAVLDEQLGMERTARVDAESRADRLREALTAASDQTDAAVNDALNQMALEIQNERATQVCFPRAQWDADRASLAGLCRTAGLGVGLD